MHGTIDLPALRRAADLLPATLDEDDRSIEVVWSTGARVRRQPLFGEVFDEELSMDPGSVRLDRLNAGGPLLKVHDTRTLDAVIGSVVPGTARIDQGRGIARVRFSQRTDVEPIWADIRAGHLRAVSIGYQVHRFEVSRPANAPELWRAVDWTPFEISAVPVGADPAAGFRAVENLTPCVVDRDDVSSNERTSMDETITTPAPAPIAAPPEAVTRAPAPVADTKTLIAEAQSAERERVATILDLTGRLGLERALADDLVARGVELDEARRVILDKVAARSEETRSFAQVATPLGGRDERLTRREAVTNALLHRYSPSLFSLGEPARSYRGMTLLELSREFLTSAGVNVRGMSRDEIATRALHSTSDFPEILAAVTNKTLRQAYEAYPQTFRPFCRQVQASDFRDIARVQLGEAPQLQKVSESGEFKRGTIGEARERYRVETYGRVVGITRQTIINDDLDAFTRLPAMYGTAIATLESDIVWAIVVSNPTMGDGTALFHATHRNLAATGAMLSTASIGDARAAMAKQTGIDKKTVLNIRPSFLLVPVALELAAEQLLAQNIVPAKMADVVPQSIRSLAVIAEPRLDSASVNAWFLAASPAQIDTIEYAYLEGQQGAYIETRNGFDVDGVEIKCRLDFGAKAIDWRGLYRNPGA
ncbi:MAG: prohead protease/major capsid protein fusion protein [Rhodospirillales bacterium]